MHRPLEALLEKSLGGSAHQRDLWFGDCTLQKTVILVPERERAECLTRLFLPRLRKTMPDCTIRVGAAEKPQSKVHTGRHPVFKNQDML